MDTLMKIGLVALLILFGLQHSAEKETETRWDIPHRDSGKPVDYLHFPGTILAVREGDQFFALLVQDRDNEDNSIVFYVPDSVVLVSDASQDLTTKNQLTVGTPITAYYPKNTPVALSLPPQATPEIIVVNSEDDAGFVHVAVFDQSLTSSDGRLKLNLSADTVVVDLQGQPAAEIAGKTLLVFYTTSTRSIPAQTTPEKVIVLK